MHGVIQSGIVYLILPCKRNNERPALVQKYEAVFKNENNINMKQTVQSVYLKNRRKENKEERNTQTNLTQGRLRAKHNITNILKYGALQWVWHTTEGKDKYDL